MQNELNSRQWKLYNFLKERGDEWTHAVDIAVSVYGVSSKNFFGSGTQRLISKDIQAINDSDVIQKVILSHRTNGIKIANEAEFDLYMRKEIMAAVRKLMRAKYKAKKGSRDGQMRITFGSERDTVKAFIDSDKAVGERLKTARLESKLTAVEVVKALNIKSVDAPMLSRFEKGYCMPNKTTLAKLGEIYGVTPEFILTGDFPAETEKHEINGLQVVKGGKNA